MCCSMLILAGYPSTHSSDEQVDEVSKHAQALPETCSRSTSKIKFGSFSVYLNPLVIDTEVDRW